MCLIFLAIDAHPDYPLIVAANRDEFFNRPTAPLHQWENSPVIAGKDLSAGGTWMGATTDGRFAALTNYRNPGNHIDNPISRGNLVREFLETQEHPLDYLKSLQSNANRYLGFNLLVGATNEIWYFSNTNNTEPTKLNKGIYGLSNHLLDTPWPKVKKGKQIFQSIITEHTHAPAEIDLTQELQRLLEDKTQAEDNELPNTGLSTEIEKALSARFIQAPTTMGYGTRCSTLLLRGPGNRLTMLEQTWDIAGNPLSQAKFSNQDT